MTRLTLRTHELPEFFGAAWGTIKAHSDAAFRRLLARFVDFYAQQLFNPHWGEQFHVQPDNTLKISMVCQGLDKTQARAMWQPFFDWVQAAPQDFSVTEELGAGARAARRWWTLEGNHSMIADTRAGVPDVSRLVAGRSGPGRCLPARLRFAVAARIAAAAGAAAAPGRGAVRRQPLQGGRAALQQGPRRCAAPRPSPRALDTATNPAVSAAFALAIIADGEGRGLSGPGAPGAGSAAAHQDARAIDAGDARSCARSRPRRARMSPRATSSTSSWQQAFWGEHYPRLRAVKAQIRSGRPVLRAPRRGQRGLERRWLHPVQAS